MRDNVVQRKSFEFAENVVLLCFDVNQNKKEYILTNQLLRSGTSVGALVREAEHAQSRKDFIHKFSIAQKEINESIYWWDLMFIGKLIDIKLLEHLRKQAVELLKIITSIIKTSKARIRIN